MSADLQEVADRTAAAIKAAIGGLATCERYAGQFSALESGRVTFLAPAVFVASSGGPMTPAGTDQIDCACKVLAYVIWQAARSRADRSLSAAALAQAVAVFAEGRQFGLAPAMPAVVKRTTALYSVALEKKGLALWVVEWEQVVRLGASVWDGAAVIPTRVFVGGPKAAVAGSYAEIV